MNSCFPFQTFCANLTQPSLLFHITCYGCSRSWAKQTKTNIKNTTTVLQRLTQCYARVPGTNRHWAAGVFRSHCPGKKKNYIRWPWMSFENSVFEILFFFSFFFWLHGCKQSSYGSSNWQERQSGGGRRREGSCTQHHRTRSQRRRGGGGPDHSFTFLLHFYFRHWKRKQKKSAKRERKVIMSQPPGTKRRISRRIWPWAELRGCYRKKKS